MTKFKIRIKAFGVVSIVKWIDASQAKIGDVANYYEGFQKYNKTNGENSLVFDIIAFK